MKEQGGSAGHCHLPPLPPPCPGAAQQEKRLRRGKKGQTLLQMDTVAKGAESRELHTADPGSQTMWLEAALWPPAFAVHSSGSKGTVWRVSFSAHSRASKASPSSSC